MLDLGSNNLEGTIQLCLGEMGELSVMDLSNTILSRIITITFSIGNQLGVINFTGKSKRGKFRNL